MNKHLKKNCFISTHNSTTFYSHIHTYTLHIIYTHTLKLTRWLPRHTTRKLYSLYYSTRHVQATVRPRGMKTTRPNSAARAKELGENKGVATNGLTNTNTNEIIPTIRWYTLMMSLGAGRDCPFPLPVIVPFHCQWWYLSIARSILLAHSKSDFKKLDRIKIQYKVTKQ
jgi:hypothetical protein